MLVKPYTLIIIITLLLCSFNGTSQIQIGVKAAYSLSFAKAQTLLFDDDFDYLQYEVAFLEEDVRPMFGIMSYYEQDKVFVQVEALYKQTRENYFTIDWSTVDRFTYNDTKQTDFLIFPISAGYKINNLKLGLGPVFYVIMNQSQIFTELENFEQRRKKMEAGFAFNVGIKLYQLHIDVTYENHFNKVGDYVIYRQIQSDFAVNPGYFTIGLSYLIF